PGWGRSVRRVREVPLRIPGVPAPDGPAGAAGERIRPDPAAARPVRAGHPARVPLSAPAPTTAAGRGRAPAGGGPHRLEPRRVGGKHAGHTLVAVRVA